MDITALHMQKKEARKHGMQSFQRLSDTIGAHQKKNRIKEIGKALLMEDELTPQRLKEIQLEKKATDEEMKEAFISASILRTYATKENMERILDGVISGLTSEKVVDHGGDPTEMTERQGQAYLDKSMKWRYPSVEGVTSTGEIGVVEGIPGKKTDLTPTSIFKERLTIKKAGETAEAKQQEITNKEKNAFLKESRSTIFKISESYLNILRNKDVYDPEKLETKRLAEIEKTKLFNLVVQYIKLDGDVNDLGAESLEAFKLMYAEEKKEETGSDEEFTTPIEDSKILDWIIEKALFWKDKQKPGNPIKEQTQVIRQPQPAIPLSQTIRKPQQVEQSSQVIKQKLKGKPAGRYEIDGSIIKWDGTKIIQ